MFIRAISIMAENTSNMYFHIDYEKMKIPDGRHSGESVHVWTLLLFALVRAHQFQFVKVKYSRTLTKLEVAHGNSLLCSLELDNKTIELVLLNNIHLMISS